MYECETCTGDMKLEEHHEFQSHHQSKRTNNE